MLKTEQHTRSRLVVGVAEMQKMFQRTDIDHFVLISPTAMIVYLKPSQIKYK